ncbi:hypothetical protein NMBNZ0533_0155 [Neisseria meningitidis NZ-05/33]|nr:hypothetical protein NMBNZ0533_0155 [Neisseria meningitidis NZ-05/33]
MEWETKYCSKFNLRVNFVSCLSVSSGSFFPFRGPRLVYLNRKVSFNKQRLCCKLSESGKLSWLI